MRTTLLLKPALRHRKFQKAQRRKIRITRTRQRLFLPVFQAPKARKRRATVIATRMFSLLQFHLPWLFLHLLPQGVISCLCLTLVGTQSSSSQLQLLLTPLPLSRRQSLEGYGNRMRLKRNLNFKLNLWHPRCIKFSFKASWDSKLLKWLVMKLFQPLMEVSFLFTAASIPMDSCNLL